MATIIKTRKEWYTLSNKLDKTIGLLTTMGNLHDAHQKMMARSVRENDISVLSIFVNPPQFNNPDDFTNYPRTLETDIVLAEETDIDYIFIPEYEDMYPDDYRYKLVENDISTRFEGSHRPGHLEGAMTVVLKLLLIIKPTRTYFGEKDYQQLQLVSDMAEAFFLETKVIPCETMRNADGLAHSSRNTLLSPKQLNHAKHFPALLKSNRPIDEIKQALSELGFIVDYIGEYKGRRYGAVNIGGVRLIDNVSLEAYA